MSKIISRKLWRRSAQLVLAGLAALALSIVPAGTTAAALEAAGSQQEAFKAAAQEFNVPVEVLMSVSYNQTRWESHQGQMSADGGFGIMNLRTKAAVKDNRGDPNRPIPTGKTTTGDFTLDKAANLLKVSPDTLKTDPVQNIRGGAAVLADQAKQLGKGKAPATLQDWYPAVAKYSGSKSTATAESFADDVYSAIKSGISAVNSAGQQLSLPGVPQVTIPDPSTLNSLGLGQEPRFPNTDGSECPTTIQCRFIPAGYGANSSDPTDYGNYDHANRPKDMKVNYIVIHDTEGSVNSAISHFQDTSSLVSAHYIIRSADGAVTQMVDTKDTAWHAGDWYLNMHSIGIEHEGYAAVGASWYTEAMYRSSAELVRYLAQKYNIPLDREHIIGHDNVPGLTDAKIPNMHWDPGPQWDWNHYMDLIHGKTAGMTSAASASVRAQGSHGNVVTINPSLPHNPQTVKVCEDGKPDVCVDQTAPSNFVYLRAAPREDAALIADPVLHPGGAPSTIKIGDWAAKAATGQQYGLAGRQGDWTAIWFAGKKAWFYNPASQPTATFSWGRTVQLKPGLAEAHVYGGAYPEKKVYPANVPGPDQPKLSYKLKAGQKYTTAGEVPTDYYYDATVDYSRPHDHEIFRGNDRYLQIWYNQRIMYVKASDVVML